MRLLRSRHGVVILQASNRAGDLTLEGGLADLLHPNDRETAVEPCVFVEMMRGRHRIADLRLYFDHEPAHTAKPVRRHGLITPISRSAGWDAKRPSPPGAEEPP